MEVYEAVRTVLAVRSYQEKAVPPDVIRRIVEAGRLTGSAMNSQPWHFIVVEDSDALRRLGALAVQKLTWRSSRTKPGRIRRSLGRKSVAPTTPACRLWLESFLRRRPCLSTEPVSPSPDRSSTG